MPTPVDSDDSDELMIFPLTDIDGCSDTNLTNDDDSFDNQNTWRGSHFMPVMTLKGRRRSLLGTTGSFSRLQRLDSVPTLRSIKTFSERREDGSLRQELDIRMLPPRDRWLWAIKNLHRLKDPWEKFHLEELKVEKAIRHRYNAIKKCWVKDVVRVKIEKEPFNHGAMRACYRLKKLDRVREGDADWKKQGRNFVAKEYMEGVERGVYFEDVRLQMDAKLWGEEYNRHRPPKKVDILQMAVIEFPDRPNSPLFHLEHFVDGIYTKYNSNSGFVEESLRLTPQAFSHFTFERSSHRLIVVDIQGVGDLWTDPQVHTAEGTGYGDGNLGVRGMALFFHSHVCNPICESLQLSKFDLCDSEIKQQGTFIKNYKNSVTRLRGEEEVCYSASPRECTDFTLLFTRGLSTTSEVFSDDSSQNDTSMDSRGCGDDNDDDEDDDEPMSFSMSPLSPPIRCHSKFLADSDESGSASITEEEERRRFQQALRAGARPSCFARESDLRRLQLNKRSGDSILGQIHHELAVYHEIGRFCQSPDEQYDIKAALYHEQLASELGVMCAILTLAHIYLGLPHDVLSSVSIEDSTENMDRGIELMISASEAGDRGAMLYMARAFQTGQGLGTKRERSYKQAVDWYNRAAQMTEVDDSGTYDATMDHPLYQIKATMAELYLTGGFDLDKDPSYAGDLFTEAAECATAAMKGKLASKYYALAEEAWGQVEE